MNGNAPPPMYASSTVIHVQVPGAAWEQPGAGDGYKSGADSPRSNLSKCFDIESPAGGGQSGSATRALTHSTTSTLSVAGTDAFGYLGNERGDWADIADVLERWPVSTVRSTVSGGQHCPEALRRRPCHDLTHPSGGLHYGSRARQSCQVLCYAALSAFAADVQAHSCLTSMRWLTPSRSMVCRRCQTPRPPRRRCGRWCITDELTLQKHTFA